MPDMYNPPVYRPWGLHEQLMNALRGGTPWLFDSTKPWSLGNLPARFAVRPWHDPRHHNAQLFWGAAVGGPGAKDNALNMIPSLPWLFDYMDAPPLGLQNIQPQSPGPR